MASRILQPHGLSLPFVVHLANPYTPSIELLCTVGFLPPPSLQKILKARCVKHHAHTLLQGRVLTKCARRVMRNLKHLSFDSYEPQPWSSTCFWPASVSLGSDISTFAVSDTPLREGLSFVNQSFSFQKPVLLALSEDYKWRREERGFWQQHVETLPNENERWKKHSVLLVAYLQEDGQPTMFSLQDIKTWPVWT